MTDPKALLDFKVQYTSWKYAQGEEDVGNVSTFEGGRRCRAGGPVSDVYRHIP